MEQKKPSDPLQISMKRKQADAPAEPVAPKPLEKVETPKAGLQFDDDPGASRSKWIAAALLVAIVAWMGSGFIFPSDDGGDEAVASDGPEPVTVAVVNSTSQPVMQYFRAEGQALPDRETHLLSETTGEIAEVLVEKGAMVEAGEVIARFVTAQRSADLTRAEEELARAQREYDNAQTLLGRGASTADRVSQARAVLAAAQAQLSAAQEAIAETELRAPFAGRLENLTVDQGEYVRDGVEVARIVDNSPLTVSVQVPQQSLSRLKAGQVAEVAFITGEVHQGVLSFLSTSADPETRTFLAEVSVDNPDGAIPAGVSAELRIPTGEMVAHFLSPAILSLGTDGTLGVKTVDDQNMVNFNAIEIVLAQPDGIWVAGLPPEARIITVGQGFVNDGEVVNPEQAPGEAQ